MRTLLVQRNFALVAPPTLLLGAPLASPTNLFRLQWQRELTLRLPWS